MSDDHHQFYAQVLIREWGEEDREKRIGPFYAPDADTLLQRLVQRGEDVLFIEEWTP